MTPGHGGQREPHPGLHATPYPVPPPERFVVLFVCTGNICRSPMAERLTRAALRVRLGDDADRILVGSAGTWGHERSAMEPFALDVLATLGVDGSDFRARELTAAMVAAADLVLGASREHRAAVATLQPRATARTFTLREFSRLAGAVDVATLPTDVVARGRALVAAAAAKRGLVPVGPDGDDLADPYGAPGRVFDQCADAIVAALQTPLDRLAPGVGSRRVTVPGGLPVQ